MEEQTDIKSGWVTTGQFADLLDGMVTKQSIKRYFDAKKFRKTELTIGNHRRIHVTDLSNPMAEIINNK